MGEKFKESWTDEKNNKNVGKNRKEILMGTKEENNRKNRRFDINGKKDAIFIK